MKLKRRDFLGLSVKLTVATAIPAVLSACGGGGSGSDSSVSTSSLTSIDKELASVDDQQTAVDANHSQTSAYNNEVASGTANQSSSAKLTASVGGSLQDATAAEQAQAIFDFFSTRTPDYSNSALLSQGAHYLLSGPQALTAPEFWTNQVSAHENAYTQYLHQLTKLKAAARLFDSKITSSDAQSKSGAMTKSSAMVIQQLEPAAADQITDLQSAISSLLSNGLTQSVLDLILSTLASVYNYMVSNISDTVQRWLFNIAANLAIDTMLEEFAKQSITDLDFSDKESILMSLAKITVAAMAIMGASQIQEIENATSDAEKDLLELLISSSDLSGKISMVWLELMSQIMGQTFTSMNTSLTSTLAAATDGGVNWEADQADLVTTLQQNSALLAILSLVVKALFAVFEDQAFADASTVSEQGFANDSAAEQFSILFASEKNTDDQTLTAFTSENLAAFMSALAGLFGSGTDMQSTFNTLASATQSAVTSTGGMTDIEDDAYNFALQLAEYAYQFSSDTASDAAEFATHMADLAYSFTMDIEEDAFQFAMQGMEYGYLFASRGEEVGVMADRILWMAVQIGVMADRIGEMADRIVYTEQLIVYTEMLILDFGVLIYGTIKQITNLILTGMALILDREWYESDSEDAVLNFISGNVSTMLTNMHEYSSAILEQQQALRGLTLDALDSVNFAAS